VIKKIALLLSLSTIVIISCIRREVTYEGKSVVNIDGSVSRSASLVIAPAAEETGSQDSAKAFTFYSDHFTSIDENLYEVRKDFNNGILTVTWNGLFTSEDMPISDYGHRIEEGPVASNLISVELKNRWFYKDYNYRETFTDPVDAAKFYPMIEGKLSEASIKVLKLPVLKGLRDPAEAKAIISDLRDKTGVKLLKAFFENPKLIDSLSERYDLYFEIAGDSLAGLAGVKLSSESATELLKDNIGAVWDSILSDHPEIFGSYGLSENEHKFRIEVYLPGCVKSTNADSALENVVVWNFENSDFFAGEKILEVSARDWHWGNVIVSVVVAIIVLLLVLWPIRRKGFA
ncbi:MAG: hypothetical protein V3W18_01935, partial [candidate division Zixibacteria bacterium]